MNLVGGGITTIALPTYEEGRECVKRMMHKLHYAPSTPPKNIELPCTLHVRHST